MRILIINFEYPPLGGGGGVATQQLAEEMARQHEVHVLTTWYKDLALNEEQSGVHIHRVRVAGRVTLPTATVLSLITFVPAALKRGWQILRSRKFDVINAQFVLPSGIPAAMLAAFFRVPFVLSFIGGDIYDPSKGLSPHRHWWLRCLVRWVARRAVRLTAISSDIKRRAMELHRVRGNIVVTPLGLKPRTVPAATRAKLQLPEGVPVFVSVGRLIPRKGYETLLSAWRRVEGAHLVIMGSGPLYTKLNTLIASYKLKDRVRLAGFVTEERKLQTLRVADAYVSAAEHEGFGIVFLEAMEAGLPIVATTEGGQADFLDDGDNALLVPPRKVKALAEAVQRLTNDPALRQQLGERNRIKVKEYYLDKTAAFFEEQLLSAREKKQV